ncbi:glycoside hydrolase [Artomyces pyxidatus]|uniref:Glycoside hydrolase n=1 Tax=Artomyces pyxidatus TaxID=48021 RepID=A0ACB8TAM2_9AGAM|nr:glycoside hydrolase [Artomyces pyxidatus]
MFPPFPSYVLGLLLVLGSTTTVIVNGTASHSIPSTLFGLMYESGDGGLYGELLQNRAFQQVQPRTATSLLAWHPVNGAALAVIADPKPLSAALPNSLQLTVPVGTSGQAGVGNEGYWGINVNSSWTYTASFFYRFPSTLPSSHVNAHVSLISASGTVFATQSAPLSLTSSWTQLSLSLKPSHSAPSILNNFTVTVDAASGTTINFALFSLFPPTFKNQKNGMRIDIAEALLELNPSFFRFPGGNNLGQTAAQRWQWNATVGPLTARPGRIGDWGYANTDGLGLLEYLTWIESMGMQNIMAVWSGYSLDTLSLPEDELAPYIEQAREQIEFAIGSTTTKGGALRASLGRPQPFKLDYVEVGNEDFFAANTYPYRWKDFVGNLSAAYPDIRFIATSDAWDPLLNPTPQSYDVHVYQTPSWFIDNAFYYDSFERNGTTYFEGEYAAISTNASDIFGVPADGRLLWSTMESASSEAAFMTGLERNSDIVFAASYAPLLATPNLVTFDAGQVVRSTSYYTQKLFSVNRGEVYLPSTLPAVGGAVAWSVTQKNSPKQFIIKIANAGSEPAALSFLLPSAVKSTGTAQVLTGPKNMSNTIDSPNGIAPQTAHISTGSTTNYTAPAYSVSVLIVSAA